MFEYFQASEAQILNNRKHGVVYVADFPAGSGKYISIAEDSISPDIDIKISSRINLRITYLSHSEKIEGIELAKVTGSRVEKIHFSTLDFERILQLLSLFTDLDLKAITNKSVVLDESIINDSDEVLKFLKLIASDPKGKQKMGEVANNYGLINPGDIDQVIQKKEAVELFDRILNSEDEFNNYKGLIGVGKDEEVWQKLFSNNSWILGSEYVDILDERRIDVENITDYLLKSFDGFVDIVELKLPTAPFWTDDNVPRSELTKATMQCSRYILQTERKINDLEFNKKIKNTPIVKPRITLVYGRSATWDENQLESYRVLNSSYTNINIITYDHLLEKAKRLIGLSKIESLVSKEVDMDNIPF